MTGECKFCGRPITGDREICEICEYTLCRKCGKKLAKGYCAVCGELVCDEDSVMVGFARVCKECLTKDPKLRNYDYLKTRVMKSAKLEISKPKKLELILKKENKLSPAKKLYLTIALDDTDSPYGMCTTYLAAKIIQRIRDKVEILDYPYLVRLNPNVPMKTRGNASVKIKTRVPIENYDDVINEVKNTFIEYAHYFFKKTSAILAIYTSNKDDVPNVFKEVYSKGVKDILTPNMVKKSLIELSEGKLEVYSATGKENGIVGAVAAIGAEFETYTFELLAYRKRENLGKPRFIDKESVIKMNERLKEWTFNNIDGERILIAPSGPDPVLYGIRGYDPRKLIEAKNMLVHEEEEFWVIFKSNQGTNAHVIPLDNPNYARPYQTVKLITEVAGLDRGKTSVKIVSRAQDWWVISNIYKPQSPLREQALRLRGGDIIEIIGAVTERKNTGTIELNLEEMHIIRLQPEVVEKNPLCPICGARMKKKSKTEYKCKKCGYRLNTNNKIVMLTQRTGLKECKRYLPPPGAQRHLTKPENFDENKIVRYKSPITPIIGFPSNKKIISGETVAAQKET